jgi:hypothetical protein
MTSNTNVSRYRLNRHMLPQKVLSEPYETVKSNTMLS